MTEILCIECNELNDPNAVKCENCKANLLEANCSEADVCENDYRYIEEAELKGEVYKLENVEDDNILRQSPFLENKFDFKIEIETNDVDFVTQIDRIPNGTDVNNHEILNVKTRKLSKSLIIEPSDIENSAVPYQCNKCSKSFKRKATLKAHVKKDHTPDDARVCFESFTSENKSKSKYEPCASPTLSESCDSEYVPPEEYEQDNTRRKQSKSPQKAKRKREQISHESDSDSNNSRKKPSSKCKTNSSPLQTVLDLKQNKPVLKRNMVYKCTACEKITSNYKEHIKHIVIHGAPADSLTETTSLEKLKKTPSGFIKCKQCEGLFMSPREYKLHEKLHQGAEVFQCDVCMAVLVTKSSLRKHKIRLHKRKTERKDRQFECIVCHEKFPAQSLMIQHRKTHLDVIKKIEEMTIIKRGNGKTTYVCKICAKTSKNKYRHEEHLRVHTKEKPYMCEKCGTKISTANALVHHLRLHENDRPFKCDICEATYRHKKSLKKHLLQHTGTKPFKCRYCEKTFLFNYTRADHERNCHMGELKGRKGRKRPAETNSASETEVPKEDALKVTTVETRSSKKLEIA